MGRELPQLPPGEEDGCATHKFAPRPSHLPHRVGEAGRRSFVRRFVSVAHSENRNPSAQGNEVKCHGWSQGWVCCQPGSSSWALDWAATGVEAAVEPGCGLMAIGRCTQKQAPVWPGVSHRRTSPP